MNQMEKKLEKMSDERLERLENACCTILNFVSYDSHRVHPFEFEQVDYILYLIHKKLGLRMNNMNNESPYKPANETLNKYGVEV